MPKQSTARSAPSRRRGASPAVPDLHVLCPDLADLFPKRPLLIGEPAQEYDALLSRVAAAVKPADVLEAIWVRDVVDLIWEAQRLRARLLVKGTEEALTTFFKGIPNSGRTLDGSVLFTAPQLARCYAEGDEEAVLEVEHFLDYYDVTLDGIMAQVIADRLPELERLERLIAGADARRSRALGEIQRHRDGLARRLRTAAADITDIPVVETHAGARA